MPLDQLSCEGRVSLGLALAGAELDDEVLPLNVAEVPEAVLEGLDEGRGAGLGGAQQADPGDFPRRLRVRAERRGEEAEDGEEQGSRPSQVYDCLRRRVGSRRLDSSAGPSGRSRPGLGKGSWTGG